MKSWRHSCALVISALLLASPASTQEPVDPNEGSAPAETDEPTDPTDPESSLEEADSELEEPDPEELNEILRMDMSEMASDIEEILVTGEQQNTLQDAPTSSTSFTAGDLQALRIDNIADLADYTPNLEINTAFAASNPTIFIRGIGLKDYNANAAGAVAVYQDGININSPAIQLGQLFDVDGIDVLRGPQGSVNGRNATAGAIMIKSALPDGEFNISTSLTYGNFNDREVEAAINIPLVEDILSMRVAGALQLRDGYTKNQCAGWVPEDNGFRATDEEATRAVYNALVPIGTYENGQLRQVDVDGIKVKKGFVYLNEPLARRESRELSGITVQPRQNPITLAEDLRDINGNLLWADDAQTIPIGRAGDPVGVMAGTLDFRLETVDGICITQAPGKISTLAGEIQHPGQDDWLEGMWRAEYGQPGVEDFAKLKPWTNNVDNWAARVVLLFEPLDNMEWMANIHGTQNRGDSFHGQMLGADALFEQLGFDEKHEAEFSENRAAYNAFLNGIGDLGEGYRNVKGIIPNSNFPEPGQGGGNPFSGFYSSDGIEFIDAWGINGWGKWDLEAFAVTLLYDFEWYNRVVEDEGDANPNRIFPAIWTDSAWQTNEELRLEGDGERYRWKAGFFFLHEELDANNFFPGIQQIELDQTFTQKLTSWAPYASGEIDLVEEDTIPGINALTLGAGLRFNHESKEFELESVARGTTSGELITEIDPELVSATWKEWTGEVQITYTPFSNEYGTLISYLKYGHGFKGGHFNAGLTLSGGNDLSQQIEPVEPEFIDAIEFGIKSRWFDDRLTLNTAVFRYWYQDLQVFDISNEAGALPIQKLLNSDAEVLGAEADLTAKPFPGFLISANMGWLDSEFKRFVVRKTILTPRGAPTPFDFDYSGNSLVSAPTWNFAVITEYEIPLFDLGSLIPQWDFNYRSKAYLDPQMTDPISQDAYWLHNMRIAYRSPDERIELAFWISNVFEKEYKVDVFDITRESNTILEIWAEPRTYGVTLSLNW